MTRRPFRREAPDRTQWLVLPGWRDEAAAEVRLALASRRLALAEAERIYRPDRSRLSPSIASCPWTRRWRLIGIQSLRRLLANGPRQGVLAWATLAVATLAVCWPLG